MAEASPHRAEWVDAARCLAMLGIMWLHSGPTPEWLGSMVGGGICLFFMLAGRFMPSEPSAAARRALKLGLAWLLWSGISLALYVLAQPQAGWTWARAFGLGEAAYNTPLWFLRALCLYQLIVAALAALRLLPRFQWILLAFLLGCSYAAEPAQHIGLRFDWLSAMLLGYCMHGVSPQRMQTWLSQHSGALLLAGALLLLQRAYYPALLADEGIRSYSCSLRVVELTWAIGYLLAGLGLVRHARPLATGMAASGRCMLFIYAGHSLAYAPLYTLPLPSSVRLAAMAALLALLTLLCRRLQELCPRAMRLLTAR